MFEVPTILSYTGVSGISLPFSGLMCADIGKAQHVGRQGARALSPIPGVPAPTAVLIRLVQNVFLKTTGLAPAQLPLCDQALYDRDDGGGRTGLLDKMRDIDPHAA